MLDQEASRRIHNCENGGELRWGSERSGLVKKNWSRLAEHVRYLRVDVEITEEHSDEIIRHSAEYDDMTWNKIDSFQSNHINTNRININL